MVVEEGPGRTESAPERAPAPGAVAYRTAVITGASRGLGRALARVFVGRGLRVLLAARSERELANLCDELRDEHGAGRAHYAVCDLTEPDAPDRLQAACREHFGSADVLVNNAGVGAYTPFVEQSADEIRRTLRVDLEAPILLTHAFLPEMIEARRGLVIQIASDLSRRFLPKMSPYVAAKFGILGFSGSLLREVKEHGVKVVTVMPGIIDTAFGGGEEGSREETWALRPELLAERVADLLDLPENVVIDELVIHPLHQDF